MYEASRTRAAGQALLVLWLLLAGALSTSRLLASADVCFIERQFVFAPRSSDLSSEDLGAGDVAAESATGVAEGNRARPLPFRECHASTIVEVGTSDAAPTDLLVAWFAGSHEGAEDVEIYTSRRSLRRAAAWSVPRRVATGRHHASGAQPTWNPVLVSAEQPLEGGAQRLPARVSLYFKMGPNPRQWWGMVQESQDGGATWSLAQSLPAGFLGPIRSKPLRLADGALLMGSSTEHDGWRAHFEHRSPEGAWRRIELPGQRPGVQVSEQIDAIQPTLLRHGEQQLQALFRSRQGLIAESWSGDQGASWSALRLTELPNPSAGVEALTLRDGTHLLIYNHTSPSREGPWERTRSRLNVARSTDGKNWYALVELENDLQPPVARAAEISETKASSSVAGSASAAGSDGQVSARYGEYSYPAAIEASDGLVHLTYTWRRRSLRYVALDPRCFEHWQAKERLIEAGAWPDLPATR